MVRQPIWIYNVKRDRCMVTLDTKFANKIIEKVKQYTDYFP